MKREDGNPLSPPPKRRKREVKDARRAAQRGEKESRPLLKTNPSLAPKKRPARNDSTTKASFEKSKSRYAASHDDDNFVEDEEIEEVKALRIAFPQPNAVEVVEAILNSADPSALTVVDGILAKRSDIAREIYGRGYRQQREAAYRYEFTEDAFFAMKGISRTPPNHPASKQGTEKSQSDEESVEDDPFQEEQENREKSGLAAPTGKLTLIAPREHFEKWAKHFRGLEPEQVKFKLSVKLTDDQAQNKVQIFRFRMGLVAKFVNYAHFVDLYNERGCPFLPNDLLLATTGIGFNATKSLRPLQLLSCSSWIIYKTVTNTETPRELWTDKVKKENVNDRILARIQDPKLEETSAEIMFHRIWPDFKTYNKTLFGKKASEKKEGNLKKTTKATKKATKSRRSVRGK